MSQPLNNTQPQKLWVNRESVAGSLIHSTEMSEFENGALEVAAPILESISNPSGGAGWSWVGCGCQKDLISDQIPTCLVPRIGGIKLQLLCGVRIEPA